MKNQKKMIIISILFVLGILIVQTVWGDYLDPNFVPSGTPSNSASTADKAISRVWSTVELILKILSVVAVIVAGVRYMFSSADKKADIKTQTFGLIVGAILVFAGSTVINFIVDIVEDVTK